MSELISLNINDSERAEEVYQIQCSPTEPIYNVKKQILARSAGHWTEIDKFRLLFSGSLNSLTHLLIVRVSLQASL